MPDAARRCLHLEARERREVPGGRQTAKTFLAERRDPAVDRLSRRAQRGVHDPFHFALRRWRECWLMPIVDRAEFDIRLGNPRNAVPISCPDVRRTRRSRH